MELRNRFKFIMMLSAVLCMPFLASCSDDDDEDDGGGSTSGEATMTIPAAIADGVQFMGLRTQMREEAIIST